MLFLGLGAFAGTIYRCKDADYASSRTATVSALSTIQRIVAFIIVSIPSIIIATICFSIGLDMIVACLFGVSVPVFIEGFMLFSGIPSKVFQRLGGVEVFTKEEGQGEQLGYHRA